MPRLPSGALTLSMAIGCCLAPASASGVEAKDRLNPESAYLGAELVASSVLSPGTATLLTAHLRNISATPIRLAVPANSYSARSARVYLQVNPAADAPESAWGADCLEKEPVVDRARMRLAGAPDGDEAPAWPDRPEGIVLLPTEGYARRLALAPGWIGADEVPRAYRYVEFDIVGMWQAIHLPADPIVPGQPIRFSDQVLGATIPTSRLLPFVHQAPAAPAVAAQATAGEGPTVELEMPVRPAAGRDLTVTYLVGNPGPSTVWIEQNRLVPPLTGWTVTVEGAAAVELPAAVAAPLPARAAIPLNAGEYLTWRRTLPASALPSGPGRIALRIAVPCWPAAEAVAGTRPTVFERTATVSLPASGDGR